MSQGFHYSIENYFQPDVEQTKINTAFKVIADHLRAVSFAISDGAFPSNKDRGYVLRRLIRRSSVYGRKLGINQAFLYQLVPHVIQAMGEFYPMLKEKEALITKTIKVEEEKFLTTLTKGYEMLMDLINKQQKVSATDALLLFESFGFPVELTQELVQEQGLSFDLVAYEALLNEVKEQSRNARKDLKA
jgi:alanyl-tRNA synthetase